MSTTTRTAKRPRLAAAIERDLLSRPASKPQVPTCFTCGRNYSRAHGRFCSSRCLRCLRRWASAHEPLHLDKFCSLPKGPTRLPDRLRALPHALRLARAALLLDRVRAPPCTASRSSRLSSRAIPSGR